MERLFYRKPIAILMIALTVIIIFLLCILLTFLTQYTSLKQTVAEINELVKRAEQDEEAKKKLLEYRNEDEYVIDWAVSMGYIPSDVYKYLPEK